MRKYLTYFVLILIVLFMWLSSNNLNDQIDHSKSQIKLLEMALQERDILIESLQGQLKEHVTSYENQIKALEELIDTSIEENRDKLFLSSDQVEKTYKQLTYLGDTYYLLYETEEGLGVYHNKYNLTLVDYKSHYYLLTDLEVNNQMSSMPVISPDEKYLSYIQPYGFELNGHVYLYDTKEMTIEKIIKMNPNKDETAKVIKWIDDDNLLIIIGLGVGTVTKGGDLYHYNIPSQILSLVKTTHDNQEIVDFQLKDDFVLLDIITWDNDFETYTSHDETIDYSIMNNLLSTQKTEVNIKEPIEISNSSLWLNKKLYSDLVLKGKPYSLPYEISSLQQSSHIGLNYPLAIIDGDMIYHLGKEEILIQQHEIVKALEMVWGKEVAKDGYLWYKDVQIQAKDFMFIDYTVHEDGIITFSLHAFLADMIDSMVGYYANNQFRFIQSPFYGQVDQMKIVSEDNRLIYTYYTGGDKLKYYLSVVDLYDMSEIETVEILNFLDDVDYSLETIQVKDIKWSNGQVLVSIEIHDDLLTRMMNDILVWQEE